MGSCATGGKAGDDGGGGRPGEETYAFDGGSDDLGRWSWSLGNLDRRMRICEASGGAGKAVAIAAELQRPWCSSDWFAFVDVRNMLGYNDMYK